MKKLLIAITAVALVAMAAPAFAAMNPFMDVPASHWAYDAVAQLASRGVVSGYPDGTYKGPQPATRYEIASIIARALAFIDMEKASKQDVEMLKRLIVEFSDELNALGVAVDILDARLGTLDRDLGGWRLAGVFEFNMKFGSDDPSYHGLAGWSDFDLDKYRIFLDKRINETTSFHARFGKNNIWDAASASHTTAGLFGRDVPMRWDYYYIDTMLPYDIGFRAGSFGINYEDDLGLVGDDAAFIGDYTRNGIQFSKDWGMASVKLAISRDNDWKGDPGPIDVMDPTWEAFLIAGNLDFHINEQFQAGVYAYYRTSDYSDTFNTTLDLAVYAKFKFHPYVTLKGVFYHQDGADRDSGSAWKVILVADQALLTFTSLQLEFASFGDDYFAWNDPYAMMGDSFGSGALAGGTVYGVKAAQKWGDTKWDSWVRWYHADYDFNDAKANSIGLGIGYQLNPAVHFELAYGYFKWDDVFGDDNGHIIRFQTLVNF